MGMEQRINNDIGSICPGDPTGWVRESQFGRWFLGTEIWRKYVLTEALGTLARLARSDVPIGGQILDIGCGQGSASSLLDIHFQPKRIIGVDIDGELIGKGRRLANEWSLSAELTLTCGCATDIPLEDASVDLVLCHQLLHHMVAQHQALAEMRRVLRTGGLLLVAESCRIFILSNVVRALFKHPVQAQHTAEEYIALVRDSGFRLIDSNIITDSPWWSLPDLGLRRHLGYGQAYHGLEPTEVLMVAERLP